MFVWSRNTVRESLHISFFCGRDPFCEEVRRSENTHGGADRSAWEASRSLPFAWATSESLSQSIISDLILSFNSHVELWTCLFTHIFFVCGLLSELIHFRVFFPVICWSYLQTEIFVTVSIGSKFYSLPSSFIFSFLWNQFVDVILRLHWICKVHPHR